MVFDRLLALFWEHFPSGIFDGVVLTDLHLALAWHFDLCHNGWGEFGQSKVELYDMSRNGRADAIAYSVRGDV